MTAATDQQPTGPELVVPATALALTATYMAATAALRSRMQAMVGVLFGRGGYRDDAARAYIDAMGPTADAAQHTMAQLTEGYLAHRVGSVTGTSTAPVGIPADLVTGSALRGVDPAEVLRRPYEQVWTALSQGKPFDEAVAVGARRAESIALTDLQLAKTHTARRVLAGDRRVTGYQRVLHGTHSCALCVLTSTRLYHKANLMPIHPGCDCSVEPLFGGQEPDPLPLEQVHAVIGRDLGDKYITAAGKGPVDYRKVIVTHEHGEIGPVLGVIGQNFRGPNDIPGG